MAEQRFTTPLVKGGNMAEKLTEFEGYFRSEEFVANSLGLRNELAKLGDCDCPCDICGVDTGKHCGDPPCDQPKSLQQCPHCMEMYDEFHMCRDTQEPES